MWETPVRRPVKSVVCYEILQKAENLLAHDNHTEKHSLSWLSPMMTNRFVCEVLSNGEIRGCTTGLCVELHLKVKGFILLVWQATSLLANTKLFCNIRCFSVIFRIISFCHFAFIKQDTGTHGNYISKGEQSLSHYARQVRAGWTKRMREVS